MTMGLCRGPPQDDPSAGAPSQHPRAQTPLGTPMRLARRRPRLSSPRAGRHVEGHGPHAGSVNIGEYQRVSGPDKRAAQLRRRQQGAAAAGSFQPVDACLAGQGERVHDRPGQVVLEVPAPCPSEGAGPSHRCPPHSLAVTGARLRRSHQLCGQLHHVDRVRSRHTTSSCSCHYRHQGAAVEIGLDRFRLSETEGCRCCSWRTRPAPEEAVLDDYADRRCLILQDDASTGGRTMSPG
ncbi:hypothetical protein QFZ56_001041 [Streptomyces achromogenes]|uniref:Uncharacterized protein n=1 Tax=Streptomyces achromogenes TaxID=67255 RepID=A0ABU0PWT1_STRAH|nr:hypothetical protein [Streptomyces achromogenes]